MEKNHAFAYSGIAAFGVNDCPTFRGLGTSIAEREVVDDIGYRKLDAS